MCWEKRLVQIKNGVNNSPLHEEILDSAKIYEKLGDTQKAQEKYEEFIKLHENKDLKGYEYHMYKGLATAYEKLGDTETAKQMWEKTAENAWEDNPEDAGEAYNKAGDKEKATQAYKNAIAYYEGIDRNGPHSNSYHLEGLVESLWALGEKSKAVQLLKDRVEDAERYRINDLSYKKGNDYEARHGKIEEGDGSDAVFNRYEDLEKYLNKYIAESSK